MIDLFFRDDGGSFKRFRPPRRVAWWDADRPIVINIGLSGTTLYGSFVGVELRRATILEF